MVQLNFNATQYDPSTGGGDVWEAGTYTVQITNSELKETKSKNGYFLALTLTCVDQHMAGRKLIARLNVQNPNPQAVEMAYRELSAISHVIGLLYWQDTQQLHGRPFKIAVTREPRNEDPSKETNNIVGYMDYAGNPPTPSSMGGSGGGQPAAPQAPSAPPAQYQQPAQGQQFQQPAPQGGGFAQAQQHGQPPAGGQFAPNQGQQQMGSAPAMGQVPGAAPGSAPMQAGAPALNPAPAQQPPQNFAPAAGGQPQNNGAPIPPWAQQPQG